jgi:putative transposase
VPRGLVGVQLAISDAHPGLKAAPAQVLGTAWQRCTVHFLRDCLGHARQDQHGLLAALIRPIFGADSGDEARRRLGEAIAQLEGRLPKIAALLHEAEDDIQAFYAFPIEHRSKLRPLERFNREIGRRTDVVAIFPDDASLIRLVSRLAIEANDERLIGRCYLSRQSMQLLWTARTETTTPPKMTNTEVGELVAASPANAFTDEQSAELLHHVPGLDYRFSSRARR